VDVCRPMKMTSVFVDRCFLLFVDDFTRKMWVYLFKFKFEVFVEFKICCIPHPTLHNKNGVVERHNCTMVAMACCMLEKNLFLTGIVLK
jgi:hypothetical protein